MKPGCVCPNTKGPEKPRSAGPTERLHERHRRLRRAVVAEEALLVDPAHEAQRRQRTADRAALEGRDDGEVADRPDEPAVEGAVGVEGADVAVDHAHLVAVAARRAGAVQAIGLGPELRDDDWAPGEDLVDLGQAPAQVGPDGRG